jgi:hypothetical protein
MIRFDQMPPEVMQAMCTPMHEVLPAMPPPRGHGAALWLGSLTASMDSGLLREHRIGHLVQVLDVPWLPDPATAGLALECYRMDILDIPSADLRSHLEGACQDIRSALARGKNVLVHCQQARYTLLVASSYAYAYGLGDLAQRGSRHRLSHRRPRHDLRPGVRVRQVEARVHQAQLGLRRLSEGVGVHGPATSGAEHGASAYDAVNRSPVHASMRGHSLETITPADFEVFYTESGCTCSACTIAHHTETRYRISILLIPHVDSTYIS